MPTRCVSFPHGRLRIRQVAAGLCGWVSHLVVHRGFLVRRASASLSFDEGSVERWFGLIGQILAEFARGSGCL